MTRVALFFASIPFLFFVAMAHPWVANRGEWTSDHAQWDVIKLGLIMGVIVFFLVRGFLFVISGGR